MHWSSGSTHSAVVSPVMGFGQRWMSWPKSIPLTMHEVPTGTQVLDWTVPKEWNVRDAYVADPAGRRVVDFAASNLHVVGYSVPVRTRMTLAELREHMHTLPNQPELVPYRTTYYKEAWGFCLSQKSLDSLPDSEYEVVIDSTLTDGSLTYAEHVVPGRVPDEVLVSCHICHPSLANDNLAGIAVAVARFSYFVWSQTDKVIVGRGVGSGGLGIYTMGHRIISTPLWAISSVIDQVTFPAFSRRQDDNGALRSGFTRSAAVIALIAFPLMAGAAAVATPMVAVVFGPKWTGLAPVIRS
jgi:Domain of unknown function (DUF2172)/Domain of unknown function (DUF4910)/Polysaccharide biosynthesis protein